MPTLLLLIAMLLLSGNVWAQELDKSQSLTLQKDAKIGVWVGRCEAAVNGLDSQAIYSGRLILQFFRQFGPTIFIFDSTWQVDPSNRTFTESGPATSQFIATLKGKEVRLLTEVSLTSLNVEFGDGVICSTRFDRGAAPAPPSDSGIFGAEHRATLFSNP
jgi:hypothetical protein